MWKCARTSDYQYIDIHLEIYYNCIPKNIEDIPVGYSARKVTIEKGDNFCLNKLETRRFPFDLIYPLCIVEYNCTSSQGEYKFIDNSLP